RGGESERSRADLKPGIEGGTRSAHRPELLARELDPHARGREGTERARDPDAERRARSVEAGGGIARGVAAVERALALEQPGQGAREAGRAECAADPGPLLRALLTEPHVREGDLGLADVG